MSKQPRVDEQTKDPYRGCEDGCTHDLVTGVEVSSLRKEDGPFPPVCGPPASPLLMYLERDTDEQ